MVISILPNKYRCGSNMGYSATEKENLLRDLNSTIDWEFCSFPKELKEGGDQKNENDWVENKKFLGETPELKPGNMFLYDGQVIAVDNEKRLILCVTETGAWAIKRFQDDIVGNEILLRGKGDENFETSDATWEKLDSLPEGFDEEYRIPYYLMKAWRDHVMPGRFDKEEKELNLKVTFSSADYIFPVELIIQDWGIRYNSEYVPEDMIKRTALEALIWTFKEFDKKK